MALHYEPRASNIKAMTLKYFYDYWIYCINLLEYKSIITKFNVIIFYRMDLESCHLM